MERNRRWIVPAFLLAVGVLAGAVWRYGYLQALDQLARRGRADLELASDRLSTQLQVYRELAVLMADHPVLDGLDDPSRRVAARDVLTEVADKTSAFDIYFVAPDGTVLVSARGGAGRSVAGSAQFRRAMQGALGSDHGVDSAGGHRVYSYAAPVFGAGGRVRGALVVVADVEDVESTWRGSAPVVYFTDTRGEVFITNRSELLFWQRPEGWVGLRPAQGAAAAFDVQTIGRHEIWRLGWGPYVPARALHLSRPLPVIGLTGEVLVDVGPARRLAGLQAAAIAAVCLAFGAVLYMTMERRRALAEANAELEQRVEARTRELSDTNRRLLREIEERHEAEAALRRAQAELVQAGKLSALGQMSAGISHELNQPLMAIQQFAENGAALLERGRVETAARNLDRIAQLAARAARIIRNLRAFARNEAEPPARIDLVAVVTAAVELTEARLRAESVVLDWVPPDGPVYAWGGEVRLGQVLINLINNAADAMADQGDRRIRIRIEDGDRLAVTVADNGPGIVDPDRIFEPFYSTKEVGGGMGLGLSISYGIVQSFGGNIRGANSPEGGAVFTVELDRWQEGEEQAA
ncbi:sensor histidine kinase [Jhaorihella thermophila]|uniref:C4-dicarboxylate transport sensor protein DctB n=1 Tax=Jhaorihella thermophila TaxID=488547 RepID=A0A1H5RVR6_9RHOB|nr:ATP-binding protein [Jhaorihella thermophila]SEF41798.1 two-component system, NtrC family, C4-dicarboxylate transport sensor histidine kinase DctB [Jhaorihella thermophila]